MALWALSLAAAALYLRGLWGDDFHRRARHYVWAWTSGVAALAIGAQAFRLGPALSVETVLYPISFVVSALLLGAVTTGMLLGHWYLIDRGLSIDPFRRMLRFFVVMLVVQAALLLVNGGLLRLLGAHASVDGLTQLFQAHASLLTVRLLLSPIAAGGSRLDDLEDATDPADDGRNRSVLHRDPVGAGRRVHVAIHSVPHVAAAVDARGQTSEHRQQTKPLVSAQDWSVV